MLPEQLQDNLQVFVVLLLILAVHNDVKVHQYKLANDIFQYIVHDVLECAGRICQAEAQYPELIHTVRSRECSFGHILRLEPDLVVC